MILSLMVFITPIWNDTSLGISFHFLTTWLLSYHVFEPCSLEEYEIGSLSFIFGATYYENVKTSDGKENIKNVKF